MCLLCFSIVTIKKDDKMNIFTRERKLLGLEIKDISSILCISQAAISYWLNFSSCPRANHVKKLLELGFSEEAALNPGKEVE